MRSEGNSLDLNNLPEDFTCRDGIQASGDNSSSSAEKKSGDKDEKDEAGKVYECRFCSLKFCKSQALGGHMNRHRQERETETLNKARQLVFSNDLGPPPSHLGYVSSGQPVQQGGYHQASNSMDETAAMRSMYPSRMLPTSPLAPPPQPVPYTFPSPPQMLQVPPPPPPNDYFVGHVMPNSCYGAPPTGNYYTCIGAPVSGSAARDGGGGEPSQQNHVEGMNWGQR